MYAFYEGSSAQLMMSDAMQKIRRLGGTTRYWELDRLERYYCGTQHDSKPSWWDGSVPARERAPLIISGLPKAAVEQAVRFTFGEGKFPRAGFSASEEPRKIGGITVSLTDDEAKALDALWSEIVEQTHLKLVLREMLRRGLSMRSACGVYRLRDGELAIDLLNAKHCEPTWTNDNKHELEKLECRYIFPREERQPDGTDKEVWYWYRRVIDSESDVVYNEVPVGDGEEPHWVRDDSRSADHGSGFTPAFWFANLPRMDVADDDGVALLDGLEDEVDAIDYSLSVRHTGAFVYGSPQAWQTGVLSHKGPREGGRTAASVETFKTDKGGTATFRVVGGGERARERSAFSVWSFEDVETELGLLEASGTSAKMVTEHITDLRARVLESIQVVLVDAATVAGQSDMSAKLLELLYAPLLALVDDLRECWGKHLRTLQGGLLRFLLVHGEREPDAVFIPGLVEALPTLKRYLLARSSGGQRWLNPPCSLLWGDYFSPTITDIREAVITAKSARGEAAAGGTGSGADKQSGPLITKKTAVEFVATYFGVEDVDAELSELEEEDAAIEAKAQEQAEREQEALHELAKVKTSGPGATKPGSGSRGGKDAKANAGGGGGGAAAAKASRKD
jgi:hypothetical protein